MEGPVALLACGAFDPPTYAHMRMFERARDFLERTLSCRVVEGIISPCGDVIGESQSPSTSSAPTSTTSTRTDAKHRLRMVESAVRRSYWIRAGDWQCSQKCFTKPLDAVQHYQKEIAQKFGSSVRILLVCGSDIFEQVTQKPSTPNWPADDVENLLKHHGLVVLRRRRFHAAHEIYRTDVLRKNQKNIFIIEDETFPNDVSSTRIRTAIRRGESVKYCLDDDVIEYISEHDLYQSVFRRRRFKLGAMTYIDERSKENSSTTPTTFSSSTRSCSTILAQDANIGRADDAMSRSAGSEASTPTELPPPPRRSSSEGRTVEMNGSVGTGTAQNLPMPRNRAKNNDDGDLDKSMGPLHCAVTPPSSACSSSLPESSGRETSEDAVGGRPRPPPVPLPAPNTLSYQSAAKKVAYSVVMRKNGKSTPPKFKKRMTFESSDENLKGGTPNGFQPGSRNCRTILSEPPMPRDLPTPPDKLLANLAFSQRHRFPKPLESPNYDNVTLDDLLEASTSWAEYMSKEADRLNGRRSGDKSTPSLPRSVESTPKLPPPMPKMSLPLPKTSTAGDRKTSSTTTPKKQKPSPKQCKEKRKGWFFGRSRSLKESKSSLEDEPIVRICGSDRREQAETSPEILWRKISHQVVKGREKGWEPTTSVTPKRMGACCVRHPGRSPEPDSVSAVGLGRLFVAQGDNVGIASSPIDEDVRGRRIAHHSHVTKSVENLSKLSPMYQQDPMSASYHEKLRGAPVLDDQNAITLRFRRYRLTATPETTV